MKNRSAEQGFGLVGILVMTVIVGVVLTVGYGVVQQQFFSNTASIEEQKASDEANDRSLTFVPSAPPGATSSGIKVALPTPRGSVTPLPRALTQIAPFPSA